jgi:hypothetical protein
MCNFWSIVKDYELTVALATLLAAFAALLAGYLAYRAGKDQVRAMREAAKQAAGDAEEQMSELRERDRVADVRRTYAAAWTISAEAQRLRMSALARRVMIEPSLGKGVAIRYERARIYIAVLESLRGGRPGIELLPRELQNLAAKLVATVDDYNAFAETAHGAEAGIIGTKELAGRLREIETIAATLADGTKIMVEALSLQTRT